MQSLFDFGRACTLLVTPGSSQENVIIMKLFGFLPHIHGMRCVTKAILSC